MRYGLALVVALALAGCHRRTSEVMPGADAEARRAAAQQTSEDLAAAGDAAQQTVAIESRAPGRPNPVRLMPDAAPDAARQLPGADNVSQEDAPTEPN